MEFKKFKVELKEGICTDIFDSPQEAIKAFGSNLKKLIEFESKEKKKIAATNTALLISARSNEDLEISHECGYSVMYNCPSRAKLYEGMPYLEVSDDSVLEGVVVRLEKYSPSVHSRWSGITPRFPDRPWRYTIYHKNSKIIPREDAVKKYGNPLNGTQGGISYIKY